MLCSKFGTLSSDKEVYLILSPSQEYWLWVLLIKINCTISIAPSTAESGKAFHLFLSSNSECRFFRCIMTSTGMKILWGISLPEFTPWTVVTDLSISSSVVPMRELNVVKNEIILLLAQSIFTFKTCCIKCAKDTRHPYQIEITSWLIWSVLVHWQIYLNVHFREILTYLLAR